MKKLFLMALIAMLTLSFNSCKSDKGKAIDVVKDFSEALKNNDKQKTAELYPSFGVNLDTSEVNHFEVDSVEVSKDGNTFKIFGGKTRRYFVVKKKGENFVITKSYGMIRLSDVNDKLEMLAKATGLIKNTNASDDQSKLERMQAINDNLCDNSCWNTDIDFTNSEHSEFVQYLLNKYPQVQAGFETKTVKVIKIELGRTYWLKVIFKGAKGIRYKVIARICSKNGEEISAQQQLAWGKGAQNGMTMFRFDTDLIGSARNVKIEYEPYSDFDYNYKDEINERIFENLCDNVSKNDYKEYLAQKKK